jgi:tol-pal system protein YbgF
MKQFFSFVLFFGLTSFLFAGTKEDLEQVQRNLVEMQQEIWNLEKGVSANDSRVQGAVKKLETSSQELRDSQAALNAKLESILNQIQALNEKLEETNSRMREMAAAAAQPQVISPTNPQNPGESAGDDNGGMAQPGVGAVGEQQLFQTAKGEYNKGNFEQALRGFQDLLDQYPNSALADDAQFMIGESYYGLKEYVDAVTEYDKVLKVFPDSDNVPGARLKKAFSLFSLGKKGQAVIELQAIIQRYPNSKEARLLDKDCQS